MKYTTTTSVLERGILTSAYKQDINRNIRIERSKSLSGIKSLIMNQSNLESQTGTILRVSLFAIAIIMISF
ncbi:hypothetical protein H9W90_09195 [Polaribacter pectinis]|uniref:Uncharacterized protein n=1 Tax=Polaribacter pectinis TaxID=2738844 RepID=A0A7G9L6Y4_9FLAO|nr:hypothetical protein [Polaribacter pectinis]QNM84383.1 hypothetical protein H9W90_09195 [Polaribacter pectinis]